MTVPDFLFHRESKDVFEIDFDAFLGTSEIISVVNAVRVQRKEPSGVWTNLTTTFGVGSTVIMASGRAIQITLGDGSTPASITRGFYSLVIFITTNTGRYFPTTHILDVLDTATA